MSENNYKIVGWPLPTLSTAVDKALMILGRLSENVQALCVEAHFRDLSAAVRLDEVINSKRISCFCWSKLSSPDDLVTLETYGLERSFMIFGDTSIDIMPLSRLPPYDWDGSFSEMFCVSIEQRHHRPIITEHLSASQAVMRRIFDAAAATMGHIPETGVKATTIYRDEYRSHRYSIAIPRNSALSFAKQISLMFDLKNGLGSYQFIGTSTDLRNILFDKRFFFRDFPKDSWHMNAPLYAPYAIAPRGFLDPELNTDISIIPKAAEVLDGLREDVVRCGISKRYIMWRLVAEERSPRSQGNYLLISPQRVGGYAIFLGYERYEDKDPLVSKFIRFAEPIIEKMGAQLKRVAGPR